MGFRTKEKLTCPPLSTNAVKMFLSKPAHDSDQLFLKRRSSIRRYNSLRYRRAPEAAVSALTWILKITRITFFPLSILNVVSLTNTCRSSGFGEYTVSVHGTKHHIKRKSGDQAEHRREEPTLSNSSYRKGGFFSERSLCY